MHHHHIVVAGVMSMIFTNIGSDGGGTQEEGDCSSCCWGGGTGGLPTRPSASTLEWVRVVHVAVCGLRDYPAVDHARHTIMKRVVSWRGRGAYWRVSQAGIRLRRRRLSSWFNELRSEKQERFDI